MLSSRPIETDIVLLGAGHAHLEVLRRFAIRPEPGVRLTLIAREPETPFFGMLPGLIRSEYTHHEAHIDLAPLAALAKARLIIAEAASFDPNASTVTIAGRPDIPFDLLSLDVGGVPPVPNDAGIPVKPSGRFLDHLHRLESELPEGARIAVVGGGPSGVELALALAARFAGALRLVLISATADPIAPAPAAARRAVREALVDAGVELICGVTATTLDAGRLLLSDGSYIEVETALWTTGIEGPALLAASGLSCDRSGCVRVTRSLRSISHRHVFAAGDCATLDGDPRPKSGAWAERAGPPLADNLRRAATGRALRRWQPGPDSILLLGLGHGRAVAWRSGIALQGRKIWWLKDRLDRRWVRKYTEMRMEPDPDALPPPSAALAPRATAIADLLATPEDAAVLKPPLGKLLVQSLDHVQSFLGDPFVLGQIAAAHALSHAYAMAAQPWTALAFASLTPASPDKMQADLAAMLQGATEILNEAGCALIGGQSAEAAEPALGFAVTALADSGKTLRKSGLQPGDHLLLTKPLGTGIALAGHRRGNARAAWLLATIASMRTTNAEAARIALTHRPRAGTHVAGLGLAGHLHEMLEASGVAAVLRQQAIPALPGAKALAAHGVETQQAAENRKFLGDAREAALLVDPQTSGGLLLGFPPTRAAACLQALRDNGINAALIGEVEPATEGAPRIRLE
jgi:selenide, water dikinase